MSKSFKNNILLLAVIGLLIFFHYMHVLAPAENLILNILSPVQEKIYNVGQKLGNLCVGEGTDQFLYDRISQLMLENAKLKILEEENQILRKELNFFEENQNKFVMARIIGQDSVEPNTLILNKGEGSGIKVGFPVVVNEGVLIGKVVKVEKEISMVLLLTDSKSKIAASILGPQNESEKPEENTIHSVLGVVSGKHGLSIEIGLIPQNEKIEKGDLVVTSGLEKDIPKGLLIGEIDSVTSEAGAVFQSATIKSLVPFNNLSIGAVVIP
jgi:rod shape-determining protein MreC